MRNKSNRRKMSEEINHNRRRFLGTTAMTIAAARFGLIGSANAQSDSSRPEAGLAITAQALYGNDGLRESSTGEGEG
jgi:nitrous oxide reductase